MHMLELAMAANVQLASSMWKTLSIITILFLLANNYMHNFLADPLMLAHKFCLNLSPTKSEYKSLYDAIVCGAEPELNNFGVNMRIIGLYHLMVVSGSHLIFLELMIGPLALRMGRYGQIFTYAVLIFFSMCCCLMPPVTRALLGFMLRKCSEELKFFWRGHHVAFFAGLITLCLFPEWIKSLSFIMSWVAALYVSLPIKSQLKKHFLVYLGLIPLFMGLQPQHPLTSVINWALGPVLGILLFPASLFSFVIKPLYILVDPLWRVTVFVTNYLGHYFILSQASLNLPLPLLWSYVAFLHILFYRYLVTKNRARL